MSDKKVLVYIYEENDDSVVSIADPIAMLSVVENPELDLVAREAQTRLQRVIEGLGGKQ